MGSATYSRCALQNATEQQLEEPTHPPFKFQMVEIPPDASTEAMFLDGGTLK